MIYRHITVTPVGVALGAEVSDISLAAVDDTAFAEIRHALTAHQVLFFRAQTLAPADHMAFARRFGALEVHEVFKPLDSHPEISVLEHDAQRPPISDSWHTDVSYRPQPSLASVLYARHIPPNGGDTLWLSACAAYDALSPALQEFLCGLEAEHDFLSAYGNYFAKQDGGAERIARARQETPPVVHPVVVVHPHSGRRVLYVNPTFTTRIIGLAAAESRAILDLLFRHLLKPEFQVRHRWRVDDVAMWDNRATQHYATGDYYPEYRRMHRITVGGDTPRGVRGEASAPIRAVR
ncbi:MAG: taurine dioxygenase [Gammaproteobacteria bacterium]